MAEAKDVTRLGGGRAGLRIDGKAKGKSENNPWSARR
jgi:hypothetical protein